MKQLRTFVLAILIFLVPSNLFLKLSVENAYLRGILVDYLIPKIYLSDLAILLFIVLALLSNNIFKQISLPKNIFNWLVIILISILTVFQVYTVHPIAAFYFLITILKFVLLFVCIKSAAFLYKSTWISWSIIATILFQSGLGLYQLFTQQELAGYWLLGEPALSYSLGLAREQVGTVEQLLPYGTTAHPNLLGGILSAYLLVLLTQLRHIKTATKWYQAAYWAALGLGGLTLWATHSVAAWLALLVGIGTLGWAQKFKHQMSAPLFLGICVLATLLIPLVLLGFKDPSRFIASSSIDRRVILNQVATQMFTAHPVLGIGLNQFTVQLEKYAVSREIVRFIQPVHSVGLLWAAETGLVGLTIVLLLFYRAWRKQKTIPIYLLLFIPMAVLDHYLVTLQSGLLLTVIIATYFQHFAQQK